MALALLLASLAPGLALGGPTAHAAGDEGSDEKVTFTVAFLNEVDSFNPFVGIEAESFEMWALTYDYMITYSLEDMSPQPGLATEWQTSEDGLTWTFTIRDDVTFSDGEPLTADDIAHTYNRVLDGGPEAATWRSYLAGVTSITAPDPTTVVLELKTPNSSLPLLPIPIVPEHVWSDIAEKEVKTYKAEPEDGEPVVGSGPFRLVEGQAGGSTYRFEANPDYWQGAPHIDKVVFRVYKSEDPAIQALLKGEVDFVEGITPLQVESLQGRDGITAISGDSPGFDEISFNAGSVDLDTGKPIGDPNPAVLDPDFRYALGFGIDRDTIIERVYQGSGQPGTTIIPPAYDAFHWEPPADVAFTYDPDKAAELLDEAGYTLGADGFRTLPNGDPIGTLRLYARSESRTSVDVMNFFQEWLADLGIRSEVSAVESSRLTDIILEGTFDAFEWGWYVEPDPSSMLDYMTCSQRGNWSDSWYCSEEYDALFEQQQTEVDDAARAEMVKEMQEILYMDAPYLVTAYNSIGEAFRSDRFACLRPQPDPGGIYLVQYGVYNYINMRPASEAGDCDGDESATRVTESRDDDSLGTGTMVGLGVAAGVVVVGALVLAMRRRATVEDRE
ncbi:ABC transporter substrate-binding protein [Nocardioides sp. GCM10027113]|uniref:ABC transporter substrate-binding protein n=1 Tax=unclassified Nocardioides TaxID=2615069 RepID=UPI00361090D6